MKILFVTAIPPWPPTDGGRQRSNLLMRALAQCGNVDMLLTQQGLTDHAPGVVERLARDFHLIEYVRPSGIPKRRLTKLLRPLAPLFRPIYGGGTGLIRLNYSPEPVFARALRRTLSAKHYDVIVGRYLRPTARLGAFDFAPLIVDVDDVDTERCRTQLRAPGTPRWARWILRQRLMQIERDVPPLLRQADHLWVCSQEDLRLLDSDRATVLPNIPFTESKVPAPLPLLRGACQHLLMVGSLKYVVNERGVDWFIRTTWPAILAGHRNARFRIVGSGMSEAQRARWSRVRGVEPVGFAENVQDEYSKAAFTVVPLFEGGGTKIKVLESLMYGRACVVTSHVERGFRPRLEHGESLLVADDERAFADACIELLNDPARRESIAARGRKQVLTHFSFPAFGKAVRNTLDRVCDLFPDGVRPAGRQ